MGANQRPWRHGFAHTFFLSFESSLFVVASNGFVLFWASVAGMLGYTFVGPLSNKMLPMLVTPYKIPVNKGTSSVVPPETRLIAPSVISASSPRFFKAFAEKIQQDVRFVEQAVLEGVCRVPNSVEAKSRPPFNVAVAKLLLHLSALLYERPEVVAHFADLYGFKIESILTDTCGVTIFYSVECNFIVIAFAGASPLDISELLSNALIRKVQQDHSVLPGQTHEAFYNSLDFGKPDIKGIEYIPVIAPSKTAGPLNVQKLLEVLENKVIPQFSRSTVQRTNDPTVRLLTDKRSPFIWFTGHSMGASLATLVLAHLVHVKHPIISSGLVKGCYTFGSPKCGDSKFASSVSKSFTANQIVVYRVVNANDFVPALPLGSSQVSPSINDDDKESSALNRESDYKHVGVPVILNYDTPSYSVGVARDWECIVKNAIWFLGVRIPAAFGKTLIGGGSFVGALQSGYPLPWEHLPAEYDRRLK
ncbi:alpha/beta-hydrolase [Rhizoclosmatium globosum]|uniref:Alpha/beta-hydrolase n=1 Tax=Rhizoclosmatium globosum TaxID=329046 RepID=A0A1Y2D0U0_9FUNG|nr:alpha/beta-hydrolase [Rhizoclosmatium globosum]|eukprot:ORY52913.1 alpha/beta-hydrolase [Rhizoclosmatium globosum]